MIRTASQDDLPALRDLFRHANDAPYDLPAVAEEKCFGRGIAGPPLVRVIGDDGRIIAAAVSCGKWLRLLAVHPEARRHGLGTALLADAEASGVRLIAAEAGNYFTPGVVETDNGSRLFFAARGYDETHWTANLRCPLRDISAQSGARRADRRDADRVLDFIDREFGGIWRFEAAKAFDRELPSIFIAEEDGALAGFAAHDANNRGLGFFGPAGVATRARGRRIGCQLVRAALADLRSLGYTTAVIPWTDALGFYSKCSGAEPAHRFVAFARAQP